MGEGLLNAWTKELTRDPERREMIKEKMNLIERLAEGSISEKEFKIKIKESNKFIERRAKEIDMKYKSIIEEQ